MDHRKIDAALALALRDVKDREAPSLLVFVQTTDVPAAAEAAVLQQHGVSVGKGRKKTFTATLSARSVEELSDQPWVQSLKLSSQRRPLQGRQPS